ncbi:PstS family phosphate ABC transporter substrate-binding protein [Aeromicrobium sp. CTD01-1L150]|uniref:PstS family phosphate ABC transporter substrate-binding protein n=1 Tax=Aeromicrobium sp. CTD01-1L150 TaxID=3341830 RepID=UPI0035BF0EDF
MSQIPQRTAVAIGAAALTFSIAACGGSAGGEDGGLAGEIVIDGSSTVTPHTIPAAELFQQEHPDVNIPVATSGTGGGFEKFCAGETDISMASRPIKEEEVDACADAGIEYTEIGVANDGLAVVVNPENDWAECLTVDELSSAWATDATAESWSQVRSDFPDEPIALFGPGSDSGTFDYFTEAINGEEGNIKTGYTDIGEDDNAAVDGVASDANAMAFLPLSFVEESGGAVRAVTVENEAGDCIEPTIETVQDGTYNPLGRQLYIYPSGDALERDEVLEFLTFYIDNQAEIAEEALFIPLTDEQEDVAHAAVDELVN